MVGTRSRSFAKAAAILIFLLAAHGTPRADRGGVESPFACGAGARALALGGAYVALAEGPTALVWNPAGIGAGARKELTFFYTSPFVEGNRYSFAGYVHPFLDFGTVGFGILRYGLDGIEKYDAGGAALGTFSNVQNEWVFSYALPELGPVTIGASLKAETHSIDGVSATGVGADFGFLVRSNDPVRSLFGRRNFTLGLAVRNAIEPALHLGDGEDRLPTLLRTGVGWRIPLSPMPGNEVNLLVGFDHGARSGGRWRFGTEYRLAGGIAARIGVGGDEWSTGLGFALRGGTLDYSFGSTELGSAHRLGLTFGFGRTLESLREERRVRDERILEEKTLSEMERKERRQFTENFDEGEALFARGDFAGAEAAFDHALLWDPASEEAARRRDETRFERRLDEGRQRLDKDDLLEAVAAFGAAVAIRPDDRPAVALLEETREKLDRSAARNREVSDRLTRGIGHLALSEFESARSEFDQALQIDPENADAKRYQVRTDSLVALRVDALVEEGNWFRDRGGRETAAARYGEALALRPDRDDLAREIARLEKPADGAPAAAREPAPPASPVREPTEDERREAEGMYRSGVDAFREGKNEEAIRYFEFVYRLMPSYESTRSYLKRAHLFVGMDRYTEGDLAGAIERWERIIEIDPEDEKALSYVRRATTEIRRTRDLSGGTP